MKKHIMIDLETLGTNVDSQILSIGACVLNEDGVHEKFYTVIDLPQDQHVNATPGTLQFWLSEGANALSTIWDNQHKLPEHLALKSLADWLNNQGDELVIWANGTKFNLGMLEHNFNQHRMPIPWMHNADRCMRTLRAYAGRLGVDFDGVPHYALDDAIWQAYYVIKAHNVLGLEWE